jgi:hypothetical protein
VLKADKDHIPTQMGMLIAHIKHKDNDAANELLKTLSVDHGTFLSIQPFSKQLCVDVSRWIG